MSRDVYRQPIITVLGHVDSGKCVGQDVLIKTEYGDVPAKELYETFSDYGYIYSLDINSLSISRCKLNAAVREKAAKIVEITFGDDSSIEVTPEHKFLTLKDPYRHVFEYIRSDGLNTNSMILSIGGGHHQINIPVNTIGGLKSMPLLSFGLGLKEVKRVKVIRGNFNVYDFSVSNNNNFIANDVIVHNTTLLDKIRGTAVQLREAGGITQHIGASLFPKETIESMCGPLLKKYNFKLQVPGLLVIDTPGHEVFTNLRRRGGSAADIAILVVDINKGFQPQTHESMQILVSRRVPFLIAANKVDLIHGWKPKPTYSILEAMKGQNPQTIAFLEERIANIITALSTYKFEGDRFDRIRDFKKTVAIIPISAKTGEGIQELMTILVGLVQRFMLDKLRVDIGRPGQGVILEVTRESGFGTILRAIHVDGVIRKGDNLIAVSPDGPVISRIRAILMPAPLDEIRDPRRKFKSIDVSYPAAGIIISAADIENVYAGSPFYTISPAHTHDPYVKMAMEEVSTIKIDTDKVGVIIKADTLGSLEAMVDYCRRKGIPVRKADVGMVSKKDVLDASIVKMRDEIRGAILAFNVGTHEDAEELIQDKNIKVFYGNILYRIVDEYLKWISSYIEERRRREFESLILPGKIKVLEGYIFRHSKPAIVGVRVAGGRIRPRYPLININGRRVGSIHQIQDRGRNISEAKKDMEVAISIREAVVGKHFDEGDHLIVDVPEQHVRKLLREFKSELTMDDLDILEELIGIKRRSNPLWAR